MERFTCDPCAEIPRNVLIETLKRKIKALENENKKLTVIIQIVVPFIKLPF
jgi:hypothetical protein